MRRRRLDAEARRREGSARVLTRIRTPYRTECAGVGPLGAYHFSINTITSSR
jgi:hypothetical protein